MNKNIIALSFVLLSTLNGMVRGQSLNFGVRVNSTPFQYLTSKNERSFYYNNSANEAYFVKGLINKQSQNKQDGAKLNFIDLPPFLLPTFYVRYETKNDFFLETELFFTYHHNEIITGKQDNFNESPLFNENIAVNFYFVSNNLLLGYKFLRTKKVRPFIIAGFNALYLVDFTTTGGIDSKNLSQDDANYQRAKPILESINNFAPVSLMGCFGFGIGFRAFTFKVSAETNITQLDYSSEPYYERFIQCSAGIGYHFLSIDLLTKKSKQAIKKKLLK